jgi:hypothetical protein
VVLQLEEATDALNVRTLELLARRLGEELRVAVVGTDWLTLPKPRAVSPYVDSMIEHCARVLSTFVALFNDTGATAAGGKPAWVPAAAFPAPKQYASRLKQAPQSASMIQSDIDRMFARKVRHGCPAVGEDTAAPSALRSGRSVSDTGQGARGRADGVACVR